VKAVPLRYIARNLWVRRVTTLLTAGGMALVVYVFATVLMMSEGIRSTLVATGQPDNVMVLRQGAGAEINSAIERRQAAILSTLPGIATDETPAALAGELLVLLGDEAVRRQRAAAALRRTQLDMDPARAAQRTEALYRELLAAPARGP
jgi:hypothetical protein